MYAWVLLLHASRTGVNASHLHAFTALIAKIYVGCPTDAHAACNAWGQYRLLCAAPRMQTSCTLEQQPIQSLVGALAPILNKAHICAKMSHACDIMAIHYPGHPVKVALMGGSLSIRGWNNHDESFIRQVETRPLFR